MRSQRPDAPYVKDESHVRAGREAVGRGGHSSHGGGCNKLDKNSCFFFSSMHGSRQSVLIIAQNNTQFQRV